MTRTPASQASGHAVRITSLTRVYGAGDTATTALRDVSLALPHGSFTAIMGPSGSGKSTLLQCAAGFDEPTSGELAIAGAPFPTGGEAAVTRFRRDRIGFVFQQYNLIGHISVLDNVLLPSRLAGNRVRVGDARRVLVQLGLDHLAGRLPAELSGGQQQRVAIARTLVGRPAVLFADEPTGALDSTSGRAVLGMLRETCDLHGRTVVMVTHDPVAAAWADAVVFLADGRIVDWIDRPDAVGVAERMARLTTGERVSTGV